ncbi:MAG TPA: alpha/beta fold hydrolase [Candidatus Binataceae bacterium]|nr:alpha/beta fold hydrolase [Candidatus Binataceae bacterium]
MTTALQSLPKAVSDAAIPEPDAVVQTRPAWVPTQLFPFTSRWTDVDGAHLHYVDEGAGPALLMVPGSPMWSFMYRRPIVELRGQFRCIAVDLPGLGLSQAPLRKGRAFAHNAGWLQGFVRQRDLRDLILIVHATAGPSALEMAVRERERIRALVISNTFAWPLDTTPLGTFARIVGSWPFAFANVNFNLLPRLTTRIGRRTGRFLPPERAAILGPYRTRRTRQHLQNLVLGLRAERAMFEGLGQRLAVFRQTPALFLFGAHDNGYRAGFLERWKKLLPNHKAVVLSESSHFVLEDEPDRYTDELKLWLKECAG